MAQTQFISHIQVAPPPTVSPRRGSGAFSAAVVVLSILLGVATAGIKLWERQLQTRADGAEERLSRLKDEFGVDSINEARKLQQRIATAQQLLNQHTYGSQILNIVEESTLPGVSLTKFNYDGGKLSIDLEANGYVQFAQQIRFYRSLVPSEIGSVTFVDPKLSDTGTVKFGVVIVPSDPYLHERPTTSASVTNTAPASTGSLSLPGTLTGTSSSTKPTTGTSTKPTTKPK